MTTYTDQIPIIRAALYDGTNEDEILANFGAVKISEVGGVLTYAAIGTVTPTWTANVGQYLHWSGTSPNEAFASDTLLPFPFIHPSFGGNASLFTVTGSANIPGSVLGATQQITVTLSAAMTNTNFTPMVFLRGAPNILSGHAVTTGGVTILSTSSVRVTIQSGVASLAGGSIFVVAQEVRNS